MRLKSLQISGYKSFAKKTDLTFTTASTAVVGPNGSGKSNIVESIRFVLGEQSMKSMRGKSGSDLIFKGSKSLPKGSRASVALTFDNSDRVFNLGEDSNISVDFDEIILSREVYPDGNNVYKINNTEVRLKDISALLSSVNIGSSGHHIISQGEADRILSSSSKDRRQMIEDALGLKVYHMKIKESERKLEKTKDHMKEVEVSRREIIPHLKFLKKQVEKVEKVEELKKELIEKYEEYLYNEDSYIKSQTDSLKEKIKSLTQEKEILQSKLEKEEKNIVHSEKTTHEEDEEKRILKELDEARIVKESLSRELGKIEGMIEIEEERFNREKSKHENNKERPAIPFVKLKSFADEIESIFREAERANTYETLKGVLNNIRSSFSLFVERFDNPSKLETFNENEYLLALKDLREKKDEFARKLADNTQNENAKIKFLSDLRIEREKKNTQINESQKNVYTLGSELQKVENDISLLSLENEKLSLVKEDFERELKEGSVLVGEAILYFRKARENTSVSDRHSQDEKRRYIERIKIKIEEMGQGVVGSDIVKEYESVSERDSFLERELKDLDESMGALVKVIGELKEELENKFRDGVQKINEEFQKLFAIMFGGGSAFLSIVVAQRRKKKGEDEEDFEEDEEGEMERGVEINVTLPHKKVKELEMLSGGERSLTSIALLFAMSQVNPPPFLVLDETDAALDEANSRRYGGMLDLLSKYSQLIVVTHNRETMSHAKVLYGITIGGDGASKLLSIKFDEATEYAK